MNQEHIGKFIAQLRKDKDLTQQELASKLGITDRAISKWERGINLPDASLMIELCEILDISVNELLTGKKMKGDTYKDNAEKNLIELKVREEQANKKLLNYEIIIGFTSSLSFMILIFVASFLNMSDIVRMILIAMAIILFSIGVVCSMKIEREVGYYECSRCHNKYIPNSIPFWFSMHMGRTRYLKCPKCHKKSWSKKVLSK